MFTGERNTGPASLSAGQLKANRSDYYGNVLKHPLKDAWYEERTPKLEDITVPALVVANWGGLALHLRGTVEGYMRISSKEKWLKVQTGSYFVTFLMPESVALQKRFFDRYLKGIDNGWEKERKVEVDVRSTDDGVRRTIVDTQWPLSVARPTRFYLDPQSRRLAGTPPATRAELSYPAMGEGVVFSWVAEHELEIAGPMVARLWVSSSTDDMDLFATLRVLDPQGRECTFLSSTEPKAPVSMGWMRVSHRKIDPRRSTELVPVHPHDEEQRLTPGEVVEVVVPIWPGSISVPPGYRLELVLQGKDYERPDETGEQRGSGWFLHTDPEDRPPARFGGTHTVHAGPGRESHLLLPVTSPRHAGQL
jgi:predicted acyl esterase